jgi:hypothetical protein
MCGKTARPNNINGTVHVFQDVFRNKPYFLFQFSKIMAPQSSNFRRFDHITGGCDSGFLFQLLFGRVRLRFDQIVYSVVGWGLVTGGVCSSDHRITENIF